MTLKISDLSQAFSNGDQLWAGISFHVQPGDVVALFGHNGAGKSTLLRVIAGEMPLQHGAIHRDGELLYLDQNAGYEPGLSIKQMLMAYAPREARDAGHQLADLEARLDTDPEAAFEIGDAYAAWSNVGGYRLEAQWDAVVRSVLGSGLDEAGTRDASTLSGGERKRLALEILFASSAGTLLLDEPDNYLDIAGKMWLEQQLRDSPKAILLVSHDRELLARAATRIVTIEDGSAWAHSGSYATYESSRQARQALLQDRRDQWMEEERRLYQHMKTMKQRAALNAKNAPKAHAAESRYQRFVQAGPPPGPATDQSIKVRLGNNDSGSVVLRIAAAAHSPFFAPLSDEVRLGERIGLVGPNGSGKSHLIQAIADPAALSSGSITLGARVTVGVFNQIHHRPELARTGLAEHVAGITGNHEQAMRILGRYSMAHAAQQPIGTLSGGQMARLEILELELAGHSLLLLDEPTDHLDIASTEALERALGEFPGTVIAVSHDRAFLDQLDRYWYLDADGTTYEVADMEAVCGAVTSSRAPNRGRMLAAAS